MSGELMIRDLGRLEGEVLVFGGCYSNLQATEALFADAKTRGIPPANMICTGDVVGYCANPTEVAERVRTSGCAVVAGNVERQIATGAGDCGCGFKAGSECDLLSQGWYPHAAARIGTDLRGWMTGLPDLVAFTHETKRYVVVHGGVLDVARFIWPVSDEAVFWSEIAAAEAAAGPVDAVLAGHCGIPFERMIGIRHWINAGVIGMPPHDGRQQARFVVLGQRGARIERLDYDAAAAATAMVRAGLTQGYDRALLTGIWPSEDVLPPEMRRSQDLASG